jgi:hypothetical protein
MNSQTRFVIIASQRSGSVMLERALASHPEISCTGEVLLGLAGPTAVEAPQVLRRKRLLRLSYSKLMSGAVFRPSKVLTSSLCDGSARAVGCRLMYNQLDPRVIRFLRKQSDIRIIHLERRDRFAQYVSRVKMRERQANLGAGSAHVARSVPLQPIEIDPRAAVIAMSKVEAGRIRFLTALAERVDFTLVYEDLARPGGEIDEGGLDAIQELLGVNPTRLEFSTARTSTTPLPQIVANYGYVAGLLEGSAYGSGHSS